MGATTMNQPFSTYTTSSISTLKRRSIEGTAQTLTEAVRRVNPALVIEATFPKHLFVKNTDTGERFRVSYLMAENGHDVTFDDVQPVVVQSEIPEVHKKRADFSLLVADALERDDDAVLEYVTDHLLEGVRIEVREMAGTQNIKTLRDVVGKHLEKASDEIKSLVKSATTKLNRPASGFSFGESFTVDTRKPVEPLTESELETIRQYRIGYARKFSKTELPKVAEFKALAKQLAEDPELAEPYKALCEKFGAQILVLTEAERADALMEAAETDKINVRRVIFNLRRYSDRFHGYELDALKKIIGENQPFAEAMRQLDESLNLSTMGDVNVVDLRDAMQSILGEAEGGRFMSSHLAAKFRQTIRGLSEMIQNGNVDAGRVAVAVNLLSQFAPYTYWPAAEINNAVTYADGTIPRANEDVAVQGAATETPKKAPVPKADGAAPQGPAQNDTDLTGVVPDTSGGIAGSPGGWEGDGETPQDTVDTVGKADPAAAAKGANKPPTNPGGTAPGGDHDFFVTPPQEADDAWGKAQIVRAASGVNAAVTEATKEAFVEFVKKNESSLKGKGEGLWLMKPFTRKTGAIKDTKKQVIFRIDSNTNMSEVAKDFIEKHGDAVPFIVIPGKDIADADDPKKSVMRVESTGMMCPHCGGSTCLCKLDEAVPVSYISGKGIISADDIKYFESILKQSENLRIQRLKIEKEVEKLKAMEKAGQAELEKKIDELKLKDVFDPMLEMDNELRAVVTECLTLIAKKESGVEARMYQRAWEETREKIKASWPTIYDGIMNGILKPTDIFIVKVKDATQKDIAQLKKLAHENFDDSIGTSELDILLEGFAKDYPGEYLSEGAIIDFLKRIWDAFKTKIKAAVSKVLPLEKNMLKNVGELHSITKRLSTMTESVDEAAGIPDWYEKVLGRDKKLDPKKMTGGEPNAETFAATLDRWAKHKAYIFVNDTKDNHIEIENDKITFVDPQLKSSGSLLKVGDIASKVSKAMWEQSFKFPIKFTMVMGEEADEDEGDLDQLNNHMDSIKADYKEVKKTGKSRKGNDKEVVAKKGLETLEKAKKAVREGGMSLEDLKLVEDFENATVDFISEIGFKVDEESPFGKEFKTDEKDKGIIKAWLEKKKGTEVKAVGEKGYLKVGQKVEMQGKPYFVYDAELQGGGREVVLVPTDYSATVRHVNVNVLKVAE